MSEDHKYTTRLSQEGQNNGKGPGAARPLTTRKEVNSMANNYLLRNIPDGLWSRAKHRAVDDKLSLRAILIKALRLYLKPKKDKK